MYGWRVTNGSNATPARCAGRTGFTIGCIGGVMKKTAECDYNIHMYMRSGDMYTMPEGGGDIVCVKCGKLTKWANRQQLFTAKIRRLLRHPERLDHVPPPPDYSTPAAISARAREGGVYSASTCICASCTFGSPYRASATGAINDRLYHKFATALAKAKGKYEWT